MYNLFAIGTPDMLLGTMSRNKGAILDKFSTNLSTCLSGGWRNVNLINIKTTTEKVFDPEQMTEEEDVEEETAPAVEAIKTKPKRKTAAASAKASTKGPMLVDTTSKAKQPLEASSSAPAWETVGGSAASDGKTDTVRFGSWGV